MSRVEMLWQALNSVKLRTFDWIGWSMVYIAKHCFNNGSNRQAKNDTFKCIYILKISKFVNKIGNNNIEGWMNDVHNLTYFDNINDLENLYNPENEYNNASILLLDHFMSDKYEIPDIINLDDILFQLVTIIGTTDNNN